MQELSLHVKPRDLETEKAAAVRKRGGLPGNLYGAGIEGSIPIQLDAVEFGRVVRQAGETDLIDLNFQDEHSPRPVLVSELQLDPVKLQPIHVDFYQVDLSEKVDVNIPIELVGEAPAVKQRRGVLFSLVDELPVRALPNDIPHELKVDVSSLEEVGDFVTVEQVELPEGVELMTEASDEEVIAKIDAFKEIEEEEEPMVEGLEEELLEGGEVGAETEEKTEEVDSEREAGGGLKR